MKNAGMELVNRAQLVLVSLALVLTCCGGTDGSNLFTDLGSGSDTMVGGDTRIDPVEIAPETPGEPDLGAETVEIDTGVWPECLPGEGCFGDACVDGGDCLSGYCVDHLGDPVCTQTCVEECPPGWNCKGVGMGGPDLVYVCLSDARVLCRPCKDNSDCISASGQEDLCVDYGTEGHFCGALCEEDSDCPAGYACLTTGEGGGEVLQCQAASGVCPCSQKSVELSLGTSCLVENEWGACPGERICTADGLTDCDAPLPAEETCNGEDDNCDGDADEDTCDDDNECTSDSCGGAEGCVNDPLDGTNCDDGDVCTVTDHCEEGSCVGTPIACDDGNLCTDDSCDGVSGCTFEFNFSSCDDGDPCTIGDQCVEGTCTGTLIPCDCQTDSDCDAYEDDDLCNGTLHCDTTGPTFQCTVDPDSVVDCPAAPGQDGPCLKAECVPENGECTYVAANEGFACNDSDSCTYGEACKNGTCSGGEPVNCEDGNECTEDDCNPDVGCIYSNAGGACNDNDACTYPDLCGAGECLPGPAVDCDDGNPCSSDSCDPGAGCTHLPLDGACNDDNLCTAGDHCEGGKCVSTAALGCDDDNPCTTDSCHPATGCLHEFNDSPCSDGNQCTVNDLCEAGQCVGGQPLDCDDANACTNDSCNAVVGCKHTNNAEPCDDVDPCTLNDHCSGGMCVGGDPLACGDDNPCTDDLCVPMAGCSHVNNTAPCDDGDVCSIGDSCLGGGCVGGELMACNDSNPCTDDSCESGQGCLFTANTLPCDDGNPCTTGGQCADGVCLGEGVKDCDDGDLCTSDYCDPAVGCVHQHNSVPCDDEDACTSGDFCLNGVCQGKAPVNCGDNNPCTDEICDPTEGCIYSFNSDPCDDFNPCTEQDACSQGSCKPGSGVVCDDGNICTSGSCDLQAGCIYVDNDNPCDDLDPCTTIDMCDGGACVGSGEFNCQDANVCTDDACFPGQGCEHTPNQAGCNDGDACTADDVCGGGVCEGEPIVCDDNDPCTENQCEPLTGCEYPITPDCCGNNIVEAGEQCDDGNQASGDGCDENCASEITTGCADGSDDQVFQQNVMVGCDGSFTGFQLANACAPGWHPANPNEYFSYGGKSVSPSQMRWVDTAWNSQGHDVPMAQWTGHYDCSNQSGWNGVCSSGNCTWVSTTEQCYLTFVDHDYGYSYGCHCRGGAPGSSHHGVMCVKDTSAKPRL